MNKENKKRLVDLYVAAHKTKYPSVPDYAIPIPKYSDSKTNGLTKCVIAFINLSGFQAERISNSGRYIDNKKTFVDVVGRNRTVGSGKWIPGSGTPGTADISSTIMGRSVKIEIKFGNDKQSPAQKRYQEMIESAGGIYIIVKTFDQFIQWYDEFIAKIRQS